MALFGRRRSKMRGHLPPSPYPTRDPAKILKMNEAAQQSPQAPSDMMIESSGSDQAVMARPSPQVPAAGQGPSPLGGSMRQPFDYDAAAKALAGSQKSPQWWQYAAAAVGDALAQNSGGRGYAMPMLLNRQARQETRQNDALAQLAKWKWDDYSRQQAADLKASSPFTIGRDRVQYNPATGDSTVLYNGAEDFELYAQRLGLQEGTPEYFDAVEDYVLRSSGPSAHSRDMQLDDYRTGNDLEMENLRFGNRQAIERMRQGNRLEVARTRSAGRGRKPNTDLPVIASPSEAAQLPSGTRFKTPDGRVKVTP